MLGILRIAYGIPNAFLLVVASPPHERFTMTDIGTEKTDETTGTKVKTFDGKIENAYGLPLLSNKWKEGVTPVAELPYVASFEEVLSYDAIPPKEFPDKDDILASVNQARKANARQKSMQKTLDDAGVIKPTLADSDELRLKTMVGSMVASKKYNVEQATTLAKQILGMAE